MNMFTLLNNLNENHNYNSIELANFYNELSKDEFVFVKPDELHCSNSEIYHSSCKHNRCFQAGGGTTSPYFSYIYCDLLNKMVLMEPLIPNHGEAVEGYYMPAVCPLLTQDTKEIVKDETLSNVVIWLYNNIKNDLENVALQMKKPFIKSYIKDKFNLDISYAMINNENKKIGFVLFTDREIRVVFIKNTIRYKFKFSLRKIYEEIYDKCFKNYCEAASK